MWCPNDKAGFFSDTTGQITPEGIVGKTLIRYTKDVKNIVEIGTWTGLGSTRCFLRGLQPGTNFFTLETNLEKIQVAQKNLESEMKPNVTFLWGSILRPQDVKDELAIFPELHNREFSRWHQIDMENLKQSPIVLDKLPEKIDFLLLDGGEFTTWYEFQILLPRCTRYIALDDVNASKCRKIRQTLKNNSLWSEIEYIPERNGFSLFQRNLQTERGWYNALLYHWQDALREKNIHGITPNDRPPAAIFADKYIQDVKALRTGKVYDFCFIGSINSSLENRLWVIQFVKDRFTENSIFVNTDTGPWGSLGSFDKTGSVTGFNPKEQRNTQSRQTQYRTVSENEFYFKTMCSSEFILCPAGDGPWSFRFYESLLCGSIPIVTSWHHTYRTVLESTFAYKHKIDTDPIFVFDPKDVDFNDDIVSAFHSLKPPKL